ncbi:MAG: addiction module protein [Opitutae bacterium]|nr:addiction module protein [Opitutae bacterium]
MTALAEKLKPQLTALPPGDRAELAHYLLSSLDGPADPGAEQAWEAELARRAAEIRAGRAEGRPAAEAFAELRQRHS